MPTKVRAPFTKEPKAQPQQPERAISPRARSNPSGSRYEGNVPRTGNAPPEPSARRDESDRVGGVHIHGPD
jgi:hypothetical protein